MYISSDVTVSDNFNQPQGTVLCFECNNGSFDECNTLCAGESCYMLLTLPLSLENITSYGCISNYNGSGCINNNITNDILCYCSTSWCNYPSILNNLTEMESQYFYYEETTPIENTLDYTTVANPFLNISKRSTNDTEENIFDYINYLELLEEFSEYISNITDIKQSSSSDEDDGNNLDEDKLLQMLNRLNMIFDERLQQVTNDLQRNINPLIDLIKENIEKVDHINNLNNHENKNKPTSSYYDYENGASSGKNIFLFNIFKQIFGNQQNYMFYSYSNNKEFTSESLQQSYFNKLINVEEEELIELENAVLSFDTNINAFILEVPNSDLTVKHTIIKRDISTGNFSIIDSIATFIGSFVYSFGEKLGVVAGSVGRTLIDGLQISIQEQMNQTLSAATLAFNTYTQLLLSKIMAVIANYVAKAQSRKRRSSFIDLSKKYDLKNYHYLYYRIKREDDNFTNIPMASIQEDYLLNHNETPTLYNDVLDKILANSSASTSFNDSEPFVPVLEDTLMPITNKPDILSNYSNGVPSIFETYGSFSVLTKNNTQSSNLSLTTTTNNNEASNNNNTSGTTSLPNMANLTTISNLITTDISTIVPTTIGSIHSSDSTINSIITSLITSVTTKSTLVPTTPNIESTIETTTKVVNQTTTSLVNTTIEFITSTTIHTTTYSITTAPIYLSEATTDKPKTTKLPITSTKIISTTTIPIITTTTQSPGIISSALNYIYSLFGFGGTTNTVITTTSLPFISNIQLPPDVIIGNNSEYMFTNGTVISPAELEVMLNKMGITMYPPTTQAPGWISGIITSTAGTISTFVSAFINEFNTNFNNRNNASISKVKGVLDSEVDGGVFENSITTMASSLSTIKSSTSSAPYDMLTGLMSAITNYGRKKRDLNNDLDIIFNNIFSLSKNSSLDINNIQILEKLFNQILSNEDMLRYTMNYLTKNTNYSSKEKFQLSRVAFQTANSIMKDTNISKMITDRIKKMSEVKSYPDEYEDTYIEDMGKSMKEMAKSMATIFNTIIENVLQNTNDYSQLSETDMIKRMHDDGYQLGLKMGFVVKPIIFNLNMIIKRLEKRKKRFAECINSLQCFKDILGKQS
uniref:PH domain-containing protein n=1 Tax=Parastrongyloides trichosuri TaxID=131310 RepID=A0A0N4ZCI2_PARTI